MAASARALEPVRGDQGDNSPIYAHPWEDPDEWPTPAWYKQNWNDQRIQTFGRFVSHELRTRYMELEGDFRTAVVQEGRLIPAASLGTVRRIFELLRMSRNMLEGTDPDPLIAAGTLNLIERYMIWFFKAELIPSRVATMINRLESAKPSGWKWFADRLYALGTRTRSEYPATLYATLDDAIWLYNQHRLVEHIDNGLQLKRLSGLRNWGLLFLLGFWMASPLATNPDVMIQWPTVPGLTESLRQAGPWTNAGGISLVGAIGGFLSALMQARDTRVSLAAYQESVLKLQIKPLVGAIVALVLFVLLSWKILPGVKIENLGSYFLIAFVSGFSERYFLKILDLDRSPDARSAYANASAPGTAPIPAPEPPSPPDLDSSEVSPQPSPASPRGEPISSTIDSAVQARDK